MPASPPTAVPAADAQQLIDSALACQKKAYGLDARVADGTSSSFCSAEGTVRIYNSHGVDLQNTIRYGAGFVQAVVEDSGEKYTGFSYLVGDTGRMDFDLLAQQAVDKAVATIGAVPMRSGKYPVVIDKEQMINLLGTFCSVFSAENAQQGLSLLQGKEGETIAAPCVTLTDDPLYPRELCARSPLTPRACPPNAKTLCSKACCKLCCTTSKRRTRPASPPPAMPLKEDIPQIFQLRRIPFTCNQAIAPQSS